MSMTFFIINDLCISLLHTQYTFLYYIVNFVLEMREKNKMGEGGCMCVVGEKKKERPG